MSDDLCERCGREPWVVRVRERRLCHGCYCRAASAGAHPSGQPLHERYSQLAEQRMRDRKTKPKRKPHD